MTDQYLKLKSYLFSVSNVLLLTNGTHRIALDILQDHYGHQQLTVIYDINSLVNIENVSWFIENCYFSCVWKKHLVY